MDQYAVHADAGADAARSLSNACARSRWVGLSGYVPVCAQREMCAARPNPNLEPKLNPHAATHATDATDATDATCGNRVAAPGEDGGERAHIGAERRDGTVDTQLCATRLGHTAYCCDRGTDCSDCGPR